MQLGSSAIPLLPAVAVGAAAVLVAVVLWGVCRARRNPPEAIPSVAPLRDAPSMPVAEDWTGERAGGAADPPAQVRRPTVADAVAARWADTGPMPAVGLPDDEPRSDAPAPTGVTDVVAEPPEPTGAVRAPGPTVGDGQATALRLVPGTSSAADETPQAPADPEPPAIGPVDSGPPRGTWLPDDRPVSPSPVPPPWSDARSGPEAAPAPVPDLDVADDPPHPVPVHGSAEPVSRAVRQALAARAVQRARRDGDPASLPSAGDPAPNGTARPADVAGRRATDPRQADARDRLLAVLLDDPARALGATVELDDTRDRIDRIGTVLRRRRADLVVAVRQLHESGLTGEQIGRLSGLDGDDVRELLEQDATEDR